MADAKEGFKKASAYSTTEVNSIVIQDDPKGPFYDKRIDKPIREGDVKNIIALGVRVPIEVSSFEGVNYVIDGRQRVKCWREAVNHWESIGEPIKPLPVIIKQTKPNDGEFISISLNEHRQDDSLLEKMERAARNIALGHEPEQVANAFGITKHQLENWLKSDSLCAPVKKLVNEGAISITAASKFADLKPAEQKEKVQELIDSGEKPTVKAAKRKVENKSSDRKPVKWTKEKIMQYAVDPKTPDHIQTLLHIVAGELELTAANGVAELDWLK